MDTLPFGDTCKLGHRYSEKLDMDSIIIRYKDNGSVRYDEKDYVESLVMIHREKSMTGALQISKNAMVKTKSRIWKAAKILFIRSTVAQSVACNTSIKPFSFTNTENCSYAYRPLKYPVPAND